MQVRNAGENVEKGGPCTLLVGMSIGAAPEENSRKLPQKIKIKLASDPAIALLGVYIHNANLQGHVHPKVYSSTSYNG